MTLCRRTTTFIRLDSAIEEYGGRKKAQIAPESGQLD